MEHFNQQNGCIEMNFKVKSMYQWVLLPWKYSHQSVEEGCVWGRQGLRAELTRVMSSTSRFSGPHLVSWDKYSNWSQVATAGISWVWNEKGAQNPVETEDCCLCDNAVESRRGKEL